MKIESLGTHLLHEKNIPFVIVIINSRIQTVDSIWSQYTDTYPSSELNRKKPNQELLAFCDANEILCFDLFRYFHEEPNQKSLYFKIDGHWNERGHLLAAQKIKGFLSKMVLH